MSRTSGVVALRATALEPIHHGAGSSGNTQLLRMQQMVNPETGRSYRVPFISGNSIKHRIRYHAVQYALDVLGCEDHSLTKAEVDLLFSGGHLTSKAGAAIDLAQARRLEQLFPALSMCGYSAGNCMTESKLRVSHLHLVCAENAWRLPDDMRKLALASVRVGALRSEEFGTRHDMETRTVGVRMIAAGEAKERAEKKAKRLPKSTKDSGDKGDSAQMLYDFQVVSAGAQFWGTVHFHDLGKLELAALASAFHYGSAGAQGGKTLMHVGAKAAVGFGLMAVELRGAVRATPAEYRDSKLLAADNDAQKSRAVEYQEHLRSHRDEIFAAIREAVT